MTKKSRRLKPINETPSSGLFSLSKVKKLIKKKKNKALKKLTSSLDFNPANAASNRVQSFPTLPSTSVTSSQPHLQPYQEPRNQFSENSGQTTTASAPIYYKKYQRKGKKNKGVFGNKIKKTSKAWVTKTAKRNKFSELRLEEIKMDPQVQKLREKLVKMGIGEMERDKAEELIRQECKKIYSNPKQYPSFDLNTFVMECQAKQTSENGNIFKELLSSPVVHTIDEDDVNSNSVPEHENIFEDVIFEGEVKKDSELVIVQGISQKMPSSIAMASDSDDEIQILNPPSPSTSLKNLLNISSNSPNSSKTTPGPSKAQKNLSKAFPSKEDFLKTPPGHSTATSTQKPLLQTTLPWNTSSKGPSTSRATPDRVVSKPQEEEEDPNVPKIVRTIKTVPGKDPEELCGTTLQPILPDLNMYLDSYSFFAARDRRVHFRGLEKVQSNSHDLLSSGLDPTYLRIVSYNVLCQTTIQRTLYLYGHLTSNKRRTFLQWDPRKTLLAMELVNLRSDVYCLQEVENTHYITFFEPLMRQHGYQGFYTQKTGGNVDGCAIFIAANKLVKVFLEQIRFNFQTEYMDKDNVAQILCLKIKNANRHVLIGNTHILFNKSRGDIKLNQLAVFFAHINKAMNKAPKNSGLILCGDFNLEPFSKVYEFITEGQLQFGDCPRNELSGQGNVGGPVLRSFRVPSKCLVTNNCMFRKAHEPHMDCQILTHPLKLASVYEHTLPDGSREVSSYHKDSACPDFIFYTIKGKEPDTDTTKKIHEKGIHPIQRLSLPSRAHYDMAFGKLPNEYAGSDHIPLLADFMII